MQKIYVLLMSAAFRQYIEYRQVGKLIVTGGQMNRDRWANE